MKPPGFKYFAPRSLDEGLALLAQHGDEAKILAGGQSLVPMLNMRLTRPAVLIDLNRVEGLDGVSAWDGGVAVRTLTRHRTLERSALVRERLPGLGEATGYIGHPAIRNRGTVGGSVAHADPAAELPAALVALEATLVARSAAGERTVAAEDFFTGFFTTSLRPDELLAEIRIPGTPAGTRGAFVELARRSGDFAICGVMALLTPKADGTVRRARISLCGVGPGPLRARGAEEILLGQVPGEAALAAAAAQAAAELDPGSDVHATAEFRRSMAAVMTKRALKLAWERTTGGV